MLNGAHTVRSNARTMADRREVRANPVEGKSRLIESTASAKETRLKIRVGFEMVYQCPQPTPMILTLNIHYSRASDLERPDHLTMTPSVPVTAYRDLFG